MSLSSIPWEHLAGIAGMATALLLWALGLWLRRRWFREQPAVDGWDLAGAAGLAMVGAGLWLRWGLHWALIFWGCVLFVHYELREWGLAVRSRRRP